MSFLVFFSKVDEFETLNADPYNSTLFKFAVYSSTPVLFLQTYEKKEVIPLYQVPTFRQTSTDDGEEIMVEVTDEDINDEVCTEILFFRVFPGFFSRVDFYQKIRLVKTILYKNNLG